MAIYSHLKEKEGVGNFGNEKGEERDRKRGCCWFFLERKRELLFLGHCFVKKGEERGLQEVFFFSLGLATERGSLLLCFVLVYSRYLLTSRSEVCVLSNLVSV